MKVSTRCEGSKRALVLTYTCPDDTEMEGRGRRRRGRSRAAAGTGEGVESAGAGAEGDLADGRARGHCAGAWELVST